MRAHVRALAAAALATAMFLSGCGSDTDDAAPTTETDGSSPEPEVFLGAGVWEFEWKGATGTVEIPAPADDARVATLEQWRQVGQIPEVIYLKVTMDNTEGTDFAEVPYVELTTSSGEKVKATNWATVNEDWRDAIEQADPDLSVEISNTYQEPWEVDGKPAPYLDQGQQGEKIFYTTVPLQEEGVTSVEVSVIAGEPDGRAAATLRE